MLYVTNAPTPALLSRVPAPALMFESMNTVCVAADFCSTVIASNRVKPASLAQALTNRAALRATQKNYAGAIADFDEVLRLYPDNAVTYHYRGTISMKRNDLDRALADLDKAIALDPKNADFYFMRAYVYKNAMIVLG